MIRLREIKLNINEDISLLKKKCAAKLKIKEEDILKINIHSESLDARHKPNLYFVYTIDIKTNKEDELLKKNKDLIVTPKEEYIFQVEGNTKLKHQPIIVGSGPAGLLCAYLLASHGYHPLIIERGEEISKRIQTVETFFNTGKLNPESNVQFGEGGAGTFSDGKLVSQVKDTSYRRKKVFDFFIKCGADNCIAYQSKPHIGTDKLRVIVKKMREEIICLGGEFRFNTCLTDIEVVDNQIKKIEINHKDWIETDVLVLALGHSARDTFEMLYNHNINMEGKPFAMGIRIQHHQSLINKNQYGINHPKLGAASYKLTYKASNNRGVYSFCMCPGGFVVNASSELGGLAINGMSNANRDEENANSAIVVTVSPNDFGNHPLDGMKFQRELEEKAYLLGQGNIPIQLFKDYKNNQVSTSLGSIKPIFKGNYSLTNLNTIFPNYINDALKEAIISFDHQIRGYACDDAIIAAIESRTSSPIRIIRDDNGESNIKGIYPCGEGAGYAGGITTASIDGIKVAEWIAKKYIP